MTSYAGFPPELPKYLSRLAAHNTKPWFDEHRADYERCYLEAAKDFVQALTPRLASVMPGLKAEPLLNRSIRRLNRDTRFAKDKTPYKTHLHLTFWLGASPKAAPAFHFVVAADHIAAGAGLWAVSPGQLDRYRRVLAEPKAARDLAKRLAETEEAGAGEPIGPALKRVPAGFDPAAPHADLARHKGIAVGRSDPIPAWLFEPAAVDEVVRRFSALAPVVRWLDRHGFTAA